MSSTVNVGTLEATLKFGDQYKAVADKFKADATAISERLTKLENGFSKTDKEVKKSKETIEKIDLSYRKVAASLDPVVAGQQKLDQATKVLDASLKKGIITQNQYNSHLTAAKSKYIDNSDAAIKSAKEIERAIQKQALEAQKAAKAQQTENAKVEAAYKRVAASLDPVIANSQKYRNAQNALEVALRRGIISQKEYNEQLGKAKEKFLSGAESAKKYQERVNDIGQKLSHTGSMLTRTVTLPLVGIAGASVKTATDLNKSLANVSALLTDLSGSQLDQAIGSMKTRVRSMSEDLGKSTKDISEGLYEVISSLGYTSDTFIQLEISAKAGAAGVASTQEAFNFLSATTKTYGDTSADAFKKAADLGFQAVNFGQTTFPQLSASIGGVAPLAKLAGVSMEEMFAVIATATGVTGNTAEVVTQMSSAINGLLNPSKDLKVLLKEQGFASGEAMIAQKGLVGTLKELVIYAEKTGKPLIELIGRKEGLILAASLAGAQELKFADNLKKMGEAAAANGAVVDAAFTKQTQGVNKAGFAWEQFKAKVETSFQRIGDTILPIILRTASAFEPVFNAALKMIDIFGSLPGSIQTVLTVFAGAAATIGPVVFISGQLIQAWAAIAAVSPKLAAVIRASAGPWTLIAIAITGATIAAQAWINKVNEAHTRELQQLQTYNETQAVYLTLRQRVKDIANAKDEETKKTLALTKAEWDSIAARLVSMKVMREQAAARLQEAKSDLERKEKLAGNKLNPLNWIPGDPRFVKLAREEFKESQAALRQQDQQWEGLQKTLHELANTGVKVAASIDNTSNSVVGLSEAQEKLVNKTNDAIAALRVKAEDAERLARAILNGTKALKSEELAIAKNSIVRDLNNSLAAEGLSLSEKQIRLIDEYVTREKVATKALSDRSQALERVIVQVGNLAEREFTADFKRFTDEAHRGMELIQDDVDGMLKGLQKIKDLDLDLEFNTRLLNVEPHLRDLEADYLSFLENIGNGFERAGENTIQAGERILATLAERFGITIDEIRDKLQALNDAPKIEALQLAGRSTLQAYRDERKEINRVVAAGAKQGIDLTEGGQKAINDLQQGFWSENLSNWSSALSFLAEEFGGFFSYLAQAVQTLQQAQAMQSSMSEMGDAMGMSSGAAGAMGAFGAYLVIAKAMYDEFQRHAESRQMRRYDYAAVFSKDAGADWNTPIAKTDKYALAVSTQIQRTAEAFAESIGGVIRIFADLEIQVRQDGKYYRAIIEGEIIGQFESMAEATSAALLGAFKSAESDIRGLSELVKAGFAYLTSDMGELKIDNLEDAGHFLSKLREISELSWSEGAISTLEQVRHFDSLWATLNKLQVATPPVIQGFNDLIAAEVNSWRAWSDSITGRQKTQEELLVEKKADAALFEAQKGFRIAELELKKLDLQAQAVFLQGKGKGLEVEAKIKQGDLKLGREFLVGKATLFNAELSLNEQFLAAIAAQIEAINILIQSLLDIPKIDVDKIKIPKNKGGGGQKDSVRDWIDDKKFDLDTRGLDEWAKRAADISRQYDQQMEQAGKDKKLRAELLALKERELQLLAQEQILAVQTSYDDFTKTANQFQDVRDTANELIKSIEDSPIGNPEKVAMIANVLQEVNDQIEELSLQSAANLFGSLIPDLEKFGASEVLLADARKHLAYIEHTLKVANYRAEFEILKANGALSKEILDTLGKAIDFVAGVDPNKLLEDGASVGEGTRSGQLYNKRREEMNQAVNNTVSDLEKLREAFRAAKDDINETVRKFDRGGFGAVDPVKSWEAALSQWKEVVSKAKGGDLEALKSASNVFGDTLDVLEKFSPALFASMAPILRNELADLGKLDTIKQGNLVITDFEKRQQHSETIDTLKSGFSDLSAHASTQQEQLGQLIGEVSGNSKRQQEINIRLMRLESANLARK